MVTENDSNITIGLFSTIKYLLLGVPLRGQSKKQIWNKLQTPFFPFAYVSLTIMIFIFQLIYANRSTDLSRDEMIGHVFRETLFQCGLLFLSNLGVMLWTVLILTITRAGNGTPGSVFTIAKRTTYFAAFFQALMAISIWSVFLYGPHHLLYGLKGTSFFALVIAPKLLAVGGPLLIVLSVTFAIIRLLCVFQGVRLSTSNSVGAALLCSVACVDVWHFLYLNSQFALFYLSSWLYG